MVRQERGEALEAEAAGEEIIQTLAIRAPEELGHQVQS
jgi:hypothetical protein